MHSSLLLAECIMSPQNSYVEILTSKVMVLECGAFGKQLGGGGDALISGVSALIGEPRELPHPSVCPVKTRQKTAL